MATCTETEYVDFSSLNKSERYQIMGGNSGSNTIHLVTWKPLWLYWPAYLALAECKKQAEFQDLNLAFDTNYTTDTEIRNAFYALVSKKEKAIAICEPKEFELTGFGRIRRVPIVLRLPHWLYHKHGSDSVYPIHALMKGSTSGDYVWQVAQTHPQFRVRPIKFSQSPTDGTLGGDKLAFDAINRSGGCLATYTPWHRFAESPANGMAKVSLPGPKSDVTSLLYVALDTDDIVSRFAAAFGTELKNILRMMGDTHGNEDLMLDFVQRSYSDVQLILESQGHLRDIDKSILTSALSEYVVMGSYFPYSSIDTAISAEIMEHLERRLNASTHSLIEGLHSDLREFLGSQYHWKDMSFVDRIEAWHSGRSKPTERTVVDRWVHGAIRRDDFLSRIAPSGANRGHSKFIDLIDHSEMPCPGGYDDPQLCDVNNIDLKLGAACGPCVISSLPQTLGKTATHALRKYAMDKGKLKLLPKIQDYINYRKPASFKDIDIFQQGHCPVSLWDLEEMLQAFSAESRATDSDAEKCQVCVYNGYNWKDKFGDVIVVINWQGNADPGHSSSDGLPGTATDYLKQLTERNSRAGRPVSWAGFWFKNGENCEHRLAAGTAKHDDLALLKFAQRQFVESCFNFAYVVAFQPQGATT